ncbi:hypothetical protein HAX54_046550 [Datura stramonium]|uniref:Uncharacterized protein n=1 Tax=Datura stramonium TaxID=4076 RepID=A0ABS8WH85_DATST|nr:hypothetical protein [Datura stramonium]
MSSASLSSLQCSSLLLHYMASTVISLNFTIDVSQQAKGEEVLTCVAPAVSDFQRSPFDLALPPMYLLVLL